MEYSMKQLESITQRPPQTIRRLMRNNEELIALLPQHRVEKSGGRVFFDDAILDWLKNYFGIEEKKLVADGVGVSVLEAEKAENPNTNAPAPANEVLIAEMRRQLDELEEQVEAKDKEIDSLNKQLEDLKQQKDKEIANLEKQLNDKEAERLHFVSQNGVLTNLLAAEKQEKLKLLPPPRESLGKRIKNYFSKNKEKGDVENDN